MWLLYSYLFLIETHEEGGELQWGACIKPVFLMEIKAHKFCDKLKHFSGHFSCGHFFLHLSGNYNKEGDTLGDASA